jgi:peptidoglycan/xylan/chitin deacetylase (PgdA/CDA1 family)
MEGAPAGAAEFVIGDHTIDLRHTECKPLITYIEALCMDLYIKNIGYQIIAQSGIPRWRHKTFFQNTLTIVMYHAVVRSPRNVYYWGLVDESSFRGQMEYLKSHFEILPLVDAVRRLRSHGLSRPTVAITFDDGYQNNYEVAFPILRAMSLPATIFLVTGLLDTDATLWTCRLHHALTETRKPSLVWNGSRFDLSKPDHRAESSVTIRTKLKDLQHPQLVTEIRSIIQKLDVDPDCALPVASPFRMLTSRAVIDMANSGLVEFGAHTHTHTLLSRLSPDEQREEIERSVSAVQELTGRPCELFAYPNGKAKDFDKETMTILQQNDVRIAVTTMTGPNNEQTPLLELRRYGIGANMNMGYFQLKVHHFVKNI